MTPAWGAFVFGFLAGYLMLRLGRKRPLGLWESKLLPPLGWVLMAASFTFAVALLAWALIGRGSTLG